MKNLNALRDEVFAINKANGWHEEERTFGELIALVHSEVSEALEDYRNGKAINEVWYEYEDGFSRHAPKMGFYIDEKWTTILGKPCGIPSELADIVIRILDICGLYEWDIEKQNKIRLSANMNVLGDKFLEILSSIHSGLSECYRDGYENNGGNTVNGLDIVVQIVEYICDKTDINLEQTIQEKLAYNRTRGYKHGGKVI